MIEIDIQKIWLGTVLACCSGVSLDVEDQDEQRDQLIAQMMGWA